jgi:putative spermidine/putrescine transport system permease protein
VSKYLKWLVWAVVGLFLLNILGILATVLVDSFATRWFATPLPEGFTLSWYAQAWDQFQLGDVLLFTGKIVGLVTLSALLLGVPCAYALARAEFPGKRAVSLLIMLPIIVPPVTYGIPLSSAMYRFGLVGTLTGVWLANLVPALPFVILVLVPFIEQIDPRLESAARVFGANVPRYFVHVLLPLLAPGILAAGLLLLIKTIGLFELTYFTSGPGTQTLVVALYYAVFGAGVRAPQAIDAMAIVYMLVSLIIVVVALQFVSPTQVVSRSRR